MAIFVELVALFFLALILGVVVVYFLLSGVVFGIIAWCCVKGYLDKPGEDDYIISKGRDH